LRNKIEHLSLPPLGPSFLGECQAMLLNFIDMLGKEFGARYCIRKSSSIVLHIYPSSENLANAVHGNRSMNVAAEFISNYRSSLSVDIWQIPEYSFKAFLLQVANNESRDVLAVQFGPYDNLSEEEKQEPTKKVALVNYRQAPVANAGTLQDGIVVDKVKKGLGSPQVSHQGREINRCNQSGHSQCWKFNRIGSIGGRKEPDTIDTRSCIYKKRHNEFGHTEAWVQFLIQELKKPGTWELFEGKRTSVEGENWMSQRRSIHEARLP